MSAEKKSRQDVEKYIISSLKNEENINYILDKNVSDVYFTPGTLKELFRLSIEYYQRFKKTLTPEVLLEEISRLSFNNQQISNLHVTFKHILSIETNPSDVPYYCEQLKNYLAGDILKSSFQEVVKATSNTDSNNNLKALENLQKILIKNQSLLESESMVKVYDVEDMEIILKEEMIDKKLNPEKYIGIKTHIKEIDEAFGTPLNIGELTLFMSEPGGGKTTTMLSVADAIWRNDLKNVVYVTLEMAANMIAKKHLSANAVTSFERIETVNLTPTNKNSIKNTFEERTRISKKAKFKYLEIESSGRIRTSTLESSIRNLLPYMKIDVLVVDYLELLYHGGEGSSTERWIQMGDVCKCLRGLGKKYGFTVISAVQLKREAISRIKKNKDKSADFGADDAQGSNQISGDADRIYGLLIDSKDGRYIKMITAKNRYGKKNFECSLYFDPECCRIYGDNTKYDHDKLFDEDKFKEIIDQANHVEDEDSSSKEEKNKNEYNENLSEEEMKKFSDGSTGNKDADMDFEDLDLPVRQ